MRTVLTAVFLAALPGALIVSVEACTYGCTERGCDALVEIRFQPAISEAGHYTFTTHANGEESTCEIDFDPSQPLSGFSRCPALLSEGTGFTSNSTPPGAPYEIIGFDLDPATQIAVRVLREGVLLVDTTVEPRIENVEINGPGCGECPTGRAEIALAR